MCICLFAFFFFSACEKEETNNKRVVPTPPEVEPDKGRFDEAPFAWDYRFTTVSEDDLFIGDLYISVNNRYMVTPPTLYIGAAYSEKNFGISFKPEVTASKNPLDVIFEFTKPFTGTIDSKHGSIGYKELFSDALESKQYKEYINNRLSPFDVKLVEVYTYEDIEKAFPYNEVLGELLSKEAKKTSTIKGIKSRMIGVLANRSFSVYADTPVQGLFEEKAMNESPENPVYIRSITYGKTAYFVIESQYSYKEVEEAVKAKLSLSNAVNGAEVLKNSTITLFSVPDNRQTANVYTRFQDLDKFLETPFNEHLYGYPIYCQGNYTKDNSAFRMKSSNTGSNSNRGEGGRGSGNRGDSGRRGGSSGRGSSRRP